ncbi:MAG: tesB 1, partial [Mycobacterium sp.]|nr:tesB 1 [Mycobacterium sp.]
MATIHEVLRVEQVDDDIFRGSSPDTTLQRTFGGQVAGQALVSAVRTIGPGLTVHSLHGYFLRPGRPTVATVYLVDRVRDGLSFATRRITAVQHGKAIFSMSASFHVQDTGPEHQDEMPTVPGP